MLVEIKVQFWVLFDRVCLPCFLNRISHWEPGVHSLLTSPQNRTVSDFLALGLPFWSFHMDIGNGVDVLRPVLQAVE